MALRLLKRAGLALLAIFAGVTVLAILTLRNADPSLYPAGHDAPVVSVAVVDHGYHAGLVLPVAQLRVMASQTGNGPLLRITQRFAAYEWLEIGWGDENFYRNVPELSFDTVHHVLRALFWRGNASILHIVGFSGVPGEVFARSRHVSLQLGDDGFMRLALAVGETFAEADGDIVDAGPGLYGPSRFFQAKGNYSVLNLCNHWTGRALAAAGVPYFPVLATFSAGLMADLQWRALR